jgi:hypothetical protein
MEQESIVYGCIKGLAPEGNEDLQRRASLTNRGVMRTLPNADDLVLLSRDMFALPPDADPARTHTEVLHFGASYVGVEYEWDIWLAEFESMLRQMYWVSATVHLETELSGMHTFTWESRRNFHEPGSGDMYVRCSWQQEGAIC